MSYLQLEGKAPPQGQQELFYGVPVTTPGTSRTQIKKLGFGISLAKSCRWS
jgi:hypothetical protein